MAVRAAEIEREYLELWHWLVGFMVPSTLDSDSQIGAPFS